MLEDDEAATAEATSSALRLLSASTPLFAALKRVNRRIYKDLSVQKARVAEERAKVDTARLSLQNLKYEESMLDLEVKVCQEFQSIFQDIELHDLQEFHQLRSTSAAAVLKTEEQDADAEAKDEAMEDGEENLTDEHKLMLTRLRFELQERKRLEARKQTLQQDKTEVVKENKEKKSNLEQIEKDLKDVLVAAEAIKAKFESF